MVLVWTRSNLFNLDIDAISWLFNDESSHFGIKFYGGSEAKFIHTNIFGGRHIDNTSKFLSTRRIVKFIEVLLPDGVEDELYYYLTRSDKHDDYDLKFFFWLTKAGLAYKFLGTPLPDVIERDNPNAAICHEMIEYLPHIDFSIDFSRAVMPDNLYDMLIDRWGTDIIDLRGN